MTDSAAMALAEAADTIEGAARAHKRAAQHHRREAARLMQRLAEIRRECERLGIDLIITQARKEPQ
jgi:hypothetical protein